MNRFTSVVLALLAATLCAQPLSRLRGRVAVEFAEARKLTSDADERGYLSAAVADLNKLHITWKRSGP